MSHDPHLLAEVCALAERLRAGTDPSERNRLLHRYYELADDTFVDCSFLRTRLNSAQGPDRDRLQREYMDLVHRRWAEVNPEAAYGGQFVTPPVNRAPSAVQAKAPSSPSRPAWHWGLGIGGLALVVAGGAWFALSGKAPESPEEPVAPVAATAPPETTVVPVAPVVVSIEEVEAEVERDIQPEFQAVPEELKGRGDRITQGDTTFEDVYLIESDALYYVRVPDRGAVESVQREGAEAVISEDAEARAALLAIWKANQEEINRVKEKRKEEKATRIAARRAELDQSQADNRAALDTSRWEFKRTEWIAKHAADRHQIRLAAHRDWRVMVAESIQLQELYNNLKLAYELIGIQDSRAGKVNSAYQQAARSLGPNYRIEDALINYKLTRDEAVKNLSTWEEEYYRKLAFLEANYATREARVAEIVALDEALPPAVLASEAMVDWSSDVSPEAFGGGGGTGTGFVVANGHVMTCEHVISGGGNITVTSTGGSAYPATVVAADATNDWALLSVSGLGGQPIPMLTDPPNVGSTIYCLGYPLGGIAGSADPIVGSGDIAAMQRLDGDSRFIQVTAPINPGNSGGPVLDQKGRWVGMVSQKLNDLASLERNQNVAQGLNFALKATFIGPLVGSRASVTLVEDTGNSDRDLSLEEVTQRLSGSIVRIDVK